MNAIKSFRVDGIGLTIGMGATFSAAIVLSHVTSELAGLIQSYFSLPANSVGFELWIRPPVGGPGSLLALVPAAACGGLAGAIAVPGRELSNAIAVGAALIACRLVITIPLATIGLDIPTNVILIVLAVPAVLVGASAPLETRRSRERLRRAHARRIEQRKSKSPDSSPTMPPN